MTRIGKPWAIAQLLEGSSAPAATGDGLAAQKAGPVGVEPMAIGRQTGWQARRAGGKGVAAQGIGAREKYSARPSARRSPLDDVRVEEPAADSSGMAAAVAITPRRHRPPAPPPHR